MSLDEVTSTIESLHKLPLLHHLMRLCPLPDFQFEKLFVAMRSLILKNLDEVSRGAANLRKGERPGRLSMETPRRALLDKKHFLIGRKRPEVICDDSLKQVGSCPHF